MFATSVGAKSVSAVCQEVTIVDVAPNPQGLA